MLKGIGEGYHVCYTLTPVNAKSVIIPKVF